MVGSKLVHAEETEALRKTLALVGTQYRQQMDALVAAATSWQRSLAEVNWPRVRTEMAQGCEKLANLGWTVPISFTLQEVAQLCHYTDTNDRLEQYMLDYFTSAAGRSYLSLRSYVLGGKDLSGWHALLEQCFDAYDRGHYLVPIPALLSVIEGAIGQNASVLKTAGKGVKAYAASLEKAAQRGSVELLIWQSTRMVVDRLFANHNFSGPHPDQLNRAWIMHGHDQRQWTQTDALRLFNLLGTIS